MGILDDALGPSSTLDLTAEAAAKRTRNDKYTAWGYTGTGPLSKLETNPYYDLNLQRLSYPLDLGSQNTIYPHFIKFNINQPAKSRYTSSTIEDPNVVPPADANRKLFNQLAGGEVGGFAAADAAAFAGAVVGATEFATDALKIAQEQDKNILPGASQLTAAGRVKNAAVASTVIAAGAVAIGTTILSQVDLTRKTKRLLQTINLYMPDQVVMQTQNKYGEVSLTKALGAAGLGLAAAKSGGGSISGILGDIAGGSFDAGEAFNKIAGGFSRVGITGVEAQASVLGAVGTKSGIFGEGIENVILQSYGYAQNPQVEILFDTTDMRMFEFTFNFLPRNEDESVEVLKIIRMFRFHAAPEIPETLAGRYYIPPSEFDIEYMYINESGSAVRNEALHKFSTCVLENIDVDYVGDSGQYVTFPNGHPVNIKLRLKFKEIEVIHKELIRNGY